MDCRQNKWLNPDSTYFSWNLLCRWRAWKVFNVSSPRGPSASSSGLGPGLFLSLSFMGVSLGNSSTGFKVFRIRDTPNPEIANTSRWENLQTFFLESKWSTPDSTQIRTGFQPSLLKHKKCPELCTWLYLKQCLNSWRPVESVGKSKLFQICVDTVDQCSLSTYYTV